MNFTFGICTINESGADTRINQIINSIEQIKLNNYEIIIIGGKGDNYSNKKNVKRIEFDETIKKNWITRKKNIIAEVANYENIVMMHDYFLFPVDWAESFKKIENDFQTCDVCCCPIIMANGKRQYIDWTTYDHPLYGHQASLNYNDWTNTKHQYISGAFFIVKKKFMLENKLDEKLGWYVPNEKGQNEDVEWSLRIREKAKIICNPFTYVQHNKIHRDINVLPRIIK